MQDLTKVRQRITKCALAKSISNAALLTKNFLPLFFCLPSLALFNEDTFIRFACDIYEANLAL